MVGDIIAESVGEIIPEWVGDIPRNQQPPARQEGIGQRGR
jgi:hypothetical protein